MSRSSTWKNTLTANGPVTEHRPPNTYGASPGGFERLRAYPTQRFSDEAALLYTAELRLTSSWDPHNWWLLDFLDVDWVQFVPFAELGGSQIAGPSLICTKM